MYNVKMKAYEGEENYLFISYAHKDSDIVWPLLDRLAEDGFRIWFDDGIAPGSEWPEYIAEHLNNSCAVVSFISPNSAVSKNCRREINYALDQDKPFIYVTLEPTELTAGIAMQLSSHEGIIKQNYPTEEVFYEKLRSALVIQPARARRPKMPQGERPQIREETPIAEKKEPSSGKSSGMSRILLPIILGILVLAGVLLYALPKGKTQEEQPEEPPQFSVSEGEPIDPIFSGSWTCYKKEQKSDSGFGFGYDSYYPDFVILSDGTLSWSEVENMRFDHYMRDPAQTRIYASAKDGSTNLPAVVTMMAGGEKADQYADLKAEYSFFDFQWNQLRGSTRNIFYTGDPDSYYNSMDQDGLKIHITGQNIANPLKKEEIDVTYLYCRSYLDMDFVKFSFYGEWTDNMGNTWRFFYPKSDKDADLTYTMTDKDGKEHKASGSIIVLGSEDAEDLFGTVIFNFQDFEHSGRITEIQSDSIVMKDGDNELILTRVNK